MIRRADGTEEGSRGSALGAPPKLQSITTTRLKGRKEPRKT